MSRTVSISPHSLLVQKNKMRSHHHDFAETTQKLMQTKYNEEYRPPNHFDAPENLAERAVALRKSNIILGKEVNCSPQP